MPTALASSCASFLQLELTRYGSLRSYVLCDPCAGDGEFLAALCSALGPDDLPVGTSPSVLAVEMEKGRAAALKERFFGESTFHGDAFHLAWNGPTANVLFLNPPYDQGRPEMEFLERFTDILVPGGVLLYVVPDKILAREDVSNHLLRNYTEHQAFRFPEPHYADFRQAILFARRSPFPLDRSNVRPMWTQPAALSVLPEVASEPHDVRFFPGAGTGGVSMSHFDASKAMSGYAPSWAGDVTEGGLPDLGDLFDRKTLAAMPPQPAHLALALASGRFNGIELLPDNSLHPPILVKGVFERVSKPASLPTRSEDDQDFRWKEVEVPSLVITVLDLRGRKVHRLKQGTLPTGSTKVEEWTAADLLINYRWNLTRELRRQFPALHQSTEALPLPELERTPFPRQNEVIQAALKVFGSGRNPMIPGEVGTGKSTIALTIAACLMDGNREPIVDALKGYGLGSTLPRVQRSLVLAPPHLMDGWKDEVKAVLPDARVVVLTKPSDLDKDGDIFLLSREKAKLGHARRGLNLCPRCGAEPEESAAVNAKRRLTCAAVRYAPGCATAIRVEYLAKAFFPFAHDVPQIATLCAGRRSGGDPRPMTWAAAHTVLAALAAVDEAPQLGGDETPQETLEIALRIFKTLGEQAEWIQSKACGEPLYTSEPRPRRVPLAKLILKKYRRKFHLLVVDEAHEYAHLSSAQTIALHRLLSLDLPVIPLSGSFMGGYASGLHGIFWAFDRKFRDAFGRDEGDRFQKRYGYSKLALSGPEPPTTKKEDKPAEYGSMSDRKLTSRRRVGQAPGIDPQFLFEYLLPIACSIQKSHLTDALPPAVETRLPLYAESAMDEELLAEYRRLQDKLITQIKLDRFDPSRAGALLGALVHLPSYLDRAFEAYQIKDPVSGKVFATGRAFGEGYRTPKESFALDYVGDELVKGNRVLFFLSHTGSGLPQRWLDLFAAEGIEAKFLDAKKVSAAKRQAWINRHVNEPGVPVLIVNPAAVQTGLNNLTGFNRVFWDEWT